MLDFVYWNYQIYYCMSGIMKKILPYFAECDLELHYMDTD